VYNDDDYRPERVIVWIVGGLMAVCIIAVFSIVMDKVLGKDVSPHAEQDRHLIIESMK